MTTGRPGPAATIEPSRRERSPVPPAPPASGTVSISSDALFAGASEVQIAHRGSIYRLKQTALGKLILTK